MNTPAIDENLTRRRAVLTAQPDTDGPGWIVELGCGHEIWCAVRPMNFTYCGECLVQLAAQARALRDQQSRPKPAPKAKQDA